jgi:hypothetical protein
METDTVYETLLSISGRWTKFIRTEIPGVFHNWMMNLTSFYLKLSSPKGNIIQAFTRRDRGKPRKASIARVSFPTDIHTRHFLLISISR